MVVEINVDSLFEERLSPSQYLLLFLCFEKKFNTVDKVIHRGFITNEELNELIEKGFILQKNIDWSEVESEKITFSKKMLTDLFVSDVDAYFHELFSTFPIKVSSNRGMRMLRPQSSDAKETKECKAKYKKYLGTANQAAKHAHVMNCLNAELAFRKQNNSLGFMRAFITWINKNEWLTYEHLIDLSNTTKTTISYGNTLI